MQKTYLNVWDDAAGKLDVVEYDFNGSTFRDDVELAFAMTYDEYIHSITGECTAAQALQIWVDMSEKALSIYYDKDPEACRIWWELELETGLIEAPEVY